MRHQLTPYHTVICTSITYTPSNSRSWSISYNIEDSVTKIVKSTCFNFDSAWRAEVKTPEGLFNELIAELNPANELDRI